MVIGLVAVVIMFQVFAVSEAQRRTTTGAGDAQQNGVTSLFLMERDVRMAGYGITYFPLFNCKSHGWNRTAGAQFDFNLLPVQIADGGAKGPDTITFMYGNPDTYALPGALANPTTQNLGFFKLKDSRIQFTPGDVMLIGEIPLAPAPQKDCWVTQVTDLPANPSQFDLVSYTGPTYIDDNGAAHSANYSPPFPLPIVYNKWVNNGTLSNGGRLYNIGPAPVAMTYHIVNNTLMASNAFDQGNDTPISDGIVQFQAQYGFSPGCATSGLTSNCLIDSTALTVGTINLGSLVAQWGDVMPATATASDWRKIVAIRMVVVARSATPGKKDTSGNCSDSLTQPLWYATVPPTQLWVDADPDWRCYRYKTFELVVPLRNLLWYADPDGTPIPPDGK